MDGCVAGNVTVTGTRAPSKLVEVEVEMMGTSDSPIDDGPSVCGGLFVPVGVGGGTAVRFSGACGPGGVTGGPRRPVLHLDLVSILYLLRGYHGNQPITFWLDHDRYSRRYQRAILISLRDGSRQGSCGCKIAQFGPDKGQKGYRCAIWAFDCCWSW